MAPDINGELLEELVDVEDGDQFLEIYGSFAEKTASRCTFDTSFSVASDLPVEGRITGGAIVPDGYPDLKRNYKNATFTADLIVLD